MNKFLKGALIAGAAIAIPAAVNAAIFSSAKAQGNALGGDGRFWPWREGDLFYTKKGDGPAIVLLHGLYPGAGIFEWRSNFDPLSENFTVYALDWLGFGLSDKPKIQYTSALLIEALLDFLREVVGKPAVLIASLQSAGIASETARIAGESVVSGIVFVNPITGCAEDEKSCPLREMAPALVHAPIVSTSVYNTFTTPAGIRKELSEQVYYDPNNVTDELVEHYFDASHQYGSQYAPLCALTGEFDIDLISSLKQLHQKSIRFIWGREAKRSPLSLAKDIVAAAQSATLSVIDHAADLPHDEQGEEFNKLIVE